MKHRTECRQLGECGELVRGRSLLAPENSVAPFPECPRSSRGPAGSLNLTLSHRANLLGEEPRARSKSHRHSLSRVAGIELPVFRKRKGLPPFRLEQACADAHPIA